MTVALSLERYLAVSKPVEYHQMTNNPSKAPRLVAYCISVVIFSVVFNVPKFFELKLNIFNATNSSVSTKKFLIQLLSLDKNSSSISDRLILFKNLRIPLFSQ